MSPPDPQSLRTATVGRGMRVLITDADYPDLALEQTLLTEAGFDVGTAQCRTQEEVVVAGQGAQAFLVQYAPITDAVLRALPQLEIISRYGVGVDTIGLEAARRRGVWVTNVPDFGIEEVTSHAMAMALTLLRHLLMYDREIRAGRWSFLSTGPLRRLKSTTFGVMGVGRIGRVMVERAKQWFGRVVACDPYIPQTQWPDGVEQASYDELFAQSHVLSLHMPLSNETRAIVNRARLARMPDSSYLITTARGGLVDLGALLWALDEGPLAAAALDVLPEEPPAPDSPLLRHPRVLLTPHAAFYSQESIVELRRKAALNIVAWASGRPASLRRRGRACVKPHRFPPDRSSWSWMEGNRIGRPHVSPPAHGDPLVLTPSYGLIRAGGGLCIKMKVCSDLEAGADGGHACA